MTRTLQLLAAIAMVALVVAGCASAPAETGTNNAATNHEKAVKFATCMRTHGVTAFPDPDASGELTIDGVVNGSSLNPSAPAFKNAISACRRLEPAGFTGHKRSAQQQENALKFAQCVRSNGVTDFPDPTPNGPLIDTNRIPSLAGRDPRSIPAFRAATDKCTARYARGMGLRGP